MTPDRIQEIRQRLETWTPQDRPIQFTEKHNPYNTRKVLIGQAELDEDVKAPFFTEAYLYNLLGKEDARSLLTRFTDLLAALATAGAQLSEARRQVWEEALAEAEALGSPEIAAMFRQRLAEQTEAPRP